MFSNKLFTFFRNNFLIFSILLILQSCGAFKLKRADVKDVPINDAEKKDGGEGALIIKLKNL